MKSSLLSILATSFQQICNCMYRHVYNMHEAHGLIKQSIYYKEYLAQNKLAAAQTKMERSMHNITYKDRKTNILVVRESTNQQCEKNEVVLIRAHQPPQRRPMEIWWRPTDKKDDKRNQPNDGETTWTNTGAARSGRGQRKTV